MGYEVGRIIEVHGLSVKAKLFGLLPPYLVNNGKRENAPKINGLVKTRVGLDIIVCQVTGEYSIENPQQPVDYYIELQVKGNIAEGRFIQGLRMLPIVSSKIETLDDCDYVTIYNASKNNITIGNDLFDEKKKIEVDINNLMPSHIGVFGNTGSGKSNTLAKIFYEYERVLSQKKTNRGRFIVFDLNNEYSNDAICDEKDKVIYTLYTRKESPKKIPLCIEELKEDELITFLNASEKTQVPVIKNAYRRAFNKEENYTEDYYLKFIRSMLVNGRNNLFQSIRYHLKDYLYNVEKFKFHSLNSVFYYDDGINKIYANQAEFDNKLDQIKIKIPEDKLDRLLLDLCFSVALENENGVLLDYILPLLSRASKLFSDFKKIFIFGEQKGGLFDNKNVCIIQLANTNKDMREIIPAIVSDHIFNVLQEEKESNGDINEVVSLVIDEAHSILYDDEDRVKTHNAVLSTFEKIIKEGRKFGCFLAISSQRPNDISQTIISQMHNYFIHKLVNPGDIQKIRNAVAYLDSKSLDFITVLGPGECVVSGTAFQMPSFIYVDQVSKQHRPNSDNVKLVGNNSLFSKNKLINSKI